MDMFRYMLFDLDGTLTDPFEGITKCFQYALASFGIEEEQENLKKVIGPPLIDAFMEFYGFSREKGEKAVAKYRERFSVVGLFENRVYPGIPEMLSRLKDAGKVLCLATAKPEVFAKRILERFDLAQYFTVVVGAELDGTRNYKNEVITEVLKQLGNPPLDEVLMIGDRKQDIVGAKECGVSALGLRFGYAEPMELEDVGCEVYAETVKELEEYLLTH